MALRWIFIMGLCLSSLGAWGKEGGDSHTHSESTHEHASSAPSKTPPSDEAPALTAEQQAHLETSFEECSHNAYTLKATQQKYCMATDGSFKACESPGKFLDPEQFPPDSTSSLALLNQYFKCAYCRPGGNITFTQKRCMDASRDLIQAEQLQTETDQKAFEDKVRYYLEDLPQGLVTAVQVGTKAYESYKKLRKAFEDLKGKKKEPPPPPPPGEEPIGPEFFWPPPPPPPPAPAPQPFGQGGATQTARADGGNKGGKFLGFGEDKKSKDKGGRKSDAAAPAGGGSGGGGGGSVGGSGGGGGEAGALSSGSSGGGPGGPTDMSDKNVAFGGGGSGSGGGGSNAIENQLLGELLSEDNKVKSRLQGGVPREGAGPSATSGARTGIVLLLERIRYTTEKTMGEIYIPTSSEE